MALLAGYPLDVCKKALNPSTGLPSRLKFPPSLAEVRDALDDVMEERWKAERHKSFEQRVAVARIAASQASTEEAKQERERRDASRRKLVADLRERFPALFSGADKERDTVPAEAKLRAMCQAAGVDFDAIPDAPTKWQKPRFQDAAE